MKDNYEFDRSLQNPYLEKSPRRETPLPPEKLRQPKARRLQELSKVKQKKHNGFDKN